jgi:hypothetical protein
VLCPSDNSKLRHNILVSALQSPVRRPLSTVALAEPANPKLQISHLATCGCGYIDCHFLPSAHASALPTPHFPHWSQNSPLARLPRMRGPRRHLGTPARMPGLRPRRLLRQLQKPARHQALSRHPAPRHRLRRARRTVALVLCGRGNGGVLGRENAVP